MKASLALLAGALAAAAAGIPGTAAALDVYPGATKLPTQMRGSIAFCRTNMTTVAYNVRGASARTVADWYERRIPGAIRATMAGTTNSTTIEVFQPDGRAAAAVTQIHYDPALAAAAKSLGADQTSLGLVTFDPALPPDWIAMIRDAARGDASAKARMKAKCGEYGSR